MATLPPGYLYGGILPPHDLNVLDLLKFPTPNECNPPNLDSPNIFTRIPSIIDNPVSARALLKLPIPSSADVIELLTRAEEASKSGYVSFEYPMNDGTQMKLSMWVVGYWKAVHEVMDAKARWIAAKQWLGKQGAEQAMESLTKLPWKYDLPRSMDGNSLGLVRFASDDWLSSTEMNLITAVLNAELEGRGMTAALALDQGFTEKLMVVFRHSRDGYLMDRSCQSMRRVGTELREGTRTEVSLFACIRLEGNGTVMPSVDEPRGNHWIAVVINWTKQEILYGDPLGFPAPLELLDALHWWIGISLDGAASFGLGILPCTRQNDGFSCSIFSANAVALWFFPFDVELLENGTAVRGGRAEMLMKIIRLIHEKEPNLSVSCSTPGVQGPIRPSVGFVPIASEFHPTSTSKPSTTKSKKRPVESVNANGMNCGTKRIKGHIPGGNTIQTKLFPSHSTSVSRSGPRVSVGGDDTQTAEDLGKDGSGWNKDDDAESGPGDDDVDVEEGYVEFGHLVDIEELRKKKGSVGAPTKRILDELLQKCYKETEPFKHIYRCIAKRCGNTYSNRNSSRSYETKREKTAASRAPSQLVQAEVAVEKAPMEVSVVDPAKDRISEDLPLTKHKSFQDATFRKRHDRHRAADLAFVKLFCAGGLPTSLASRPEWVEALTCLDPKYLPASRTKLEDDQIPAEAAAVQQKMYQLLEVAENLTISCDGGTSRGREAFWTLHISTEDRKVYFVEGREATRDSHTAVWLKTWLLEIMDKIGRWRFCSAVCDSTGNTRLCRELLVDEVPTMFNLPDICHHISNTIKNIVSIDFFKMVISVIRGVIAKFHLSHLGNAELDYAKSVLGIGRGLETIGKTRFGTIILSAQSVQRNIRALRMVVDRGKFSLGEFADYFKEFPGERLSRPASKFATGLGQLIDIGKPAITALTHLEANEASPGDVYTYWHAILQATRDVLRDADQEIPLDVQNEIIGILNYRHNQVFGDGNLSDSATVYLAGTYLHPLYLTSDIFKHESSIPPPAYGVDYTGIPYPTAFKRVVNFLSAAAKDEIEFGRKDRLTKWKGLGRDFKERLLDEVQRYARHQYPYNQPYRKKMGIMSWWRSIEGQEFGDVLPTLALKIHAVRVNSMPEERTVSTFTWMSPALRSQLKVGSMTSMTQIKQFYQAERKPRIHSNPNPSARFEAKPGEQKIKEEVLDDMDDKWLDEPPTPTEPADDLEASLINMLSKSLGSVLLHQKVVKEASSEVVKALDNAAMKQGQDEDYVLEL
ncbi:ribonuclease H-like domain-containing protein [Lyophyllum atratum]|nr:ribonuclease H-like domain-containing protein [Lyophyllum atratum]